MLVHPNYPSSFQLIKEIRREFGADKPKRSLSDALDDFQEFLIQEHSKEKTNVLIIDEAQNMRPPLFEILRQLLNFETSTEKLLQIVLFGQNELASKVDRQPELKDRITIFGALTSLTRQDSEALIDFRWKMAGGDKHPFTTEALDAIFKYSRGLPRKMCKLCDNALIRAFSAQTKSVDENIIGIVAEEIRLASETEEKQKVNKVGRKKKVEV